MSDPRTFKLDTPHMEGADVRAWREWLVEKFASWNIAYPLPAGSDYDQATRAATASLCRAWGIDSAQDAMSEGVTPWLRTKLRDDRRSDAEEKTFKSAERVEYRRALRERHDNTDVSTPITNIIEDSWGWHPGVHDGIDLICAWKAPLLAIVTGKIVRVASSGWWGLGAKPSAGHPVSDGDGIIILEGTVDVGPFKRGMHFCYGHAEGAAVHENQSVRAGDVIGHAGFANAAHCHFMVNDNPAVNGFYSGTGDRDPKPYVDFARRNG